MESNPPNILFLFADQYRPDWLGTNPDVPVRTPNIAELAERGTQFTNAVCPSPVCNPSRACLASGYEYDRCGTPANNVDFPLSQTTLYERLRDEAGYHVMGCGKFDLTSDFPLGLSGDHGVHRWGFTDAIFNPALNNTVRRVRGDPNREPRDPYTAHLENEGLLETHVEDYERRWGAGSWETTFPTPLPDEAYYDNWITRNGLALLDDAPDDQPWYLEVDFQNPHHPWDITEEMHGWYRDPDVTFPDPVDCDLPVSSKAHQEIRRNYAAMVEHLDRCVGRVMERLDARGELDNTLVVFSSDHGEMLGDHGQWQKLSPLQMSVGVPLVCAGPCVANQDPVDDPATILDLHATFLDVAGLNAGPVDSRSMVPVLTGNDSVPRDVVYSGLSSWRMVYDGTHKLIKGYDPDLRRGGTYEPMMSAPENTRRRQAERDVILHDVPVSETENIAAEHPALVEELSTAMDKYMQRPNCAD